MKPTCLPALQRGFTLAEAIITLVVVGVIAGIVAVFIRVPVQGYADSVARAELTDQADLAMRRMARDLRLALPNSVRTLNGAGTAVEFMLTKAGGRYLSLDDGGAGSPLDFGDPSKTEFSVVGATPSLSARIATGDYVVVNNLGTAPTNAYDFAPGCNCNIAEITGVTRSGTDVAAIQMRENPFGRPGSLPSPAQRFQVVSGPVTYACVPDGQGAFTLMRYWGYQIAAAGSVPPATPYQSAPLATRVDQCAGMFEYAAGAERVGLVIVKLSLRPRSGDDPPARLVHQVHVDNSP